MWSNLSEEDKKIWNDKVNKNTQENTISLKSKELLNNLTVLKLKQIALTINIAQCGTKEKLINKILKALTTKEIQKSVKQLKTRKYFVRCINVKVYHFYYSKTNFLGELIELTQKLNSGKGKYTKCKKCRNHTYITIWLNEFCEK